MRLPEIKTKDEFIAFKRTAGAELAALQVVAQHAGLPTDCLTVFTEGSAVIGSVGDTVIKLFGPCDEAHARTERRVLEVLAGHNSVPAPQLRGAAVIDGWNYVLMSKLQGVPASKVWSGLSPQRRRAFCENVGRLTAELHAVDPTPLLDIPPQWDVFLKSQLANAVDTQRRRSLDERWLKQLRPYLDKVELGDSEPVLLHTELMLAHVFVDPETLQIMGVLDFEPAMVGNAEYELASVGLFLCGGEPSMFGAFLKGYGRRHNAELARRCLGYALLHRYSHLPWYLKFMPMDDVETLEAMAARWWCE